MSPARHVREVRRGVDHQPFLIIWEVTRACELACAHCRADAVRARHPLELTTVEGKALLDDIASIGPPHPLVVLTGGDPFSRADLAELVAHGTAAGLHVALSPSVTPRLTHDALSELRAAGASAVSLSLDGAGPTTHDGFRGIDGVFDATLDAAKDVRELGYRLQINTTVTASNVNELPDILGHVLDLGAFLWSVFFLVPTGRGSRLLPLDADRVEDVLHWLVDVSHHAPVKTTEAPHFRRVVLERTGTPAGTDIARAFGLGPTYEALARALADMVATRGLAIRQPRPPLAINAGRGFVFVNHIGIVHPSGFLPIPCGSVRDDRLSTLYRTSVLLRQLRDPTCFTGKCGTCEYATVCGGSRSHAHAVTGDPLGDDPSCRHVPELSSVALPS